MGTLNFNNYDFKDMLSDILFNDAYSKHDILDHYQSVKLAYQTKLTDEQQREFVSALYDNAGEYYRHDPEMILIDNKYHKIIRTGEFIGRFKIWLFYSILFNPHNITDCLGHLNPKSVNDAEVINDLELLLDIFKDCLQLMMKDCLDYNEKFYTWFEKC